MKTVKHQVCVGTAHDVMHTVKHLGVKQQVCLETAHDVMHTVKHKVGVGAVFEAASLLKSLLLLLMKHSSRPAQRSPSPSVPMVMFHVSLKVLPGYPGRWLNSSASTQSFNADGHVPCLPENVSL
eukprot:1136864-Pelagomonas_calceolata.AAC.1